MESPEPRKELSRLERELVLQYLRDDNVPVTVTLEEKPVQSEADFSAGTASLSDADRVPASAVFPVAIPAQQMTVLEQGIILLRSSMRETMRTIQPFLGKTVRVQFYFNRMGLYFVTTMKECSQGLALVVPSAIFRIPDVSPVRNYDFSASVSYSSASGTVTLPCRSLDDYPLFTLPAWGDIDLAHQKEAKAILELIMEDVRTGKAAPVGNGLHLFPVCRYMTLPVPSVPSAVQGRLEPFDVLYVDEQKMVLGSRGGCSALGKDSSYDVQLSFAVTSHAAFKRVIRTQAVCQSEYRFASDDGIVCYVLSFTSVKEEDTRFLYERLRGKLMEG